MIWERKYGYILGTIVVLILSVVAAYFYFKYREATRVGAQEVAFLARKIERVMELPSEPPPTVATVTDVTKLQSQEFFTKAQNGDKVLFYVPQKRAVLYRPSTGKIVDVVPIQKNDTVSSGLTSTATAEVLSEAAESEPEATPEPEPIEIALYNGTTTVGVTGTAESSLENFGYEYQVTARENAANSDYTETVVIDISGGNDAEVRALAQLFGARIEELPEAETAPAADVLVIVGGSI